MEVEVKNAKSFKVDKGFVRKVVSETLQSMRIKGNITVGVVFVSAHKMQEVNRKYRNIDKPTDVLSISYNEDLGTHKYLGEILVCMEEVKKRAKESRTTPKRELAHVMIHGTLHLLGWEHEGSTRATDRMHAKEEEIMTKFL